MPRRKRHDAPGRYHHVMNRGVAKRVCFPDRAAKRRFLALLACSVRRGEIEIVAFVILDTHFHLLVRSTDAGLSYAMMRIENAYVRYFNRRHRRDGPLFRGRFLSLPVRSPLYFRAVVAYIDFNAVKARIVEDAAQYPYGSARAYATVRRGPPWLSRRVIESRVRFVMETDDYRPSDYGRVYRKRGEEVVGALVEERIRQCVRGPDPLDDLVGRRPAAVARWMQSKALLADGLKPWMPVAAAATIDQAIELVSKREGRLRIKPGRSSVCAWTVMRSGLLHGLAGMRVSDIASHVDSARSTVSRRVRVHIDHIRLGGAYLAAVSRVARKALRLTHGDQTGGDELRRI